MYTCSPRGSTRVSCLGLVSTPFPTETGRGNESGQKPEPTIIWWLVVSLLTSGATITPNLPPPVFQLSMTNEHFGNSFRHTHNPLSWRQQQKLMTMWIAERQKMHYNGQGNCYTLQEGVGMGAGCCINWKVQCSFVFLQAGDETQPSGGVGSSPWDF